MPRSRSVLPRTLSVLFCRHTPTRVETLKSCQRWLRLKLACQVRLSSGSRRGSNGPGGNSGSSPNNGSCSNSGRCQPVRQVWRRV